MSHNNSFLTKIGDTYCAAQLSIFIYYYFICHDISEHSEFHILSINRKYGISKQRSRIWIHTNISMLGYSAYNLGFLKHGLQVIKFG